MINERRRHIWRQMAADAGHFCGAQCWMFPDWLFPDVSAWRQSMTAAVSSD